MRQLVGEVLRVDSCLLAGNSLEAVGVAHVVAPIYIYVCLKEDRYQ